MQLEFRKITPFGYAPPPNRIQAYFEMNRPTRYQFTAKLLTEMDRRTDVRRVRQQYVFFSKEERITKNYASWYNVHVYQLSTQSG